MTKKKEKVVAEVKLDEKEPVKPKGKSEKKAFEELIARYKKQNPVKYEMKKKRLEEKLKSLK